MPYYSRHGLTIPADTATFAYDAAGNLVRAVNGYASVARMYSIDGVVGYDDLRIRTYGDPGTTPGAGYGPTYRLAYSYTRDRRRTLVLHPSVLAAVTRATPTPRPRGCCPR